MAKNHDKYPQTHTHRGRKKESREREWQQTVSGVIYPSCGGYSALVLSCENAFFLFDTHTPADRCCCWSERKRSPLFYYDHQQPMHHEPRTITTDELENRKRNFLKHCTLMIIMTSRTNNNVRMIAMDGITGGGGGGGVAGSSISSSSAVTHHQGGNFIPTGSTFQ